MTKPLLPTRDFDFLGLDRWTLLSRLQVLMNQAIPEWSDFSLAHPENALLEGNAMLSSMACSQSREMARQMYYAVVSRRLPLQRLARAEGYFLGSSTAAEVDGYFILQGTTAATKAVTLPTGTRLLVGSQLYRTKTDTSISIGSVNSGTVTVENAEEHTRILASPNDEPNWYVDLVETPYIDVSASVSAADGDYSEFKYGTTKWRSFLEMSSSDKGFIVFVDDEGAAKIQFGNGINGKIPQGDTYITYKSGGGEAGQVVAGVTWRVVDSVYDSDGNQVTVGFTNPSASVSGTDQETVEEGRIRAPLNSRVVESVVNESDCETVLEAMGGIGRAACVTSEQVSTVPEDEAWIYLVAQGSPYTASGYYPPAQPTTSQIATAQAKLGRDGSTPALMNTRPTVYAATFFTVSVSVKIFKTVGYNTTDTRSAIENALQRFFAIADADKAPLYEADWGYKYGLLGNDGLPEITWSDIFEVVAGVDEVRKIPDGNISLLLNGSGTSLTIPELQFPILGSITIYDMDSGGAAI